MLRQPLNVPKYLLLAAAIPMHWIALLTPMPAKPIALVAILTIYHNLQYHRLIWFHNQKYGTQRVSPADCTRRDACVPDIRPRGLHQPPADHLHRARNHLRHHLPGTTPILRLSESSHRRLAGRAFAADSTRHRLSVGLRLYSLLSGFENLAGAQRSFGGQSAEDVRTACVSGRVNVGNRGLLRRSPTRYAAHPHLNSLPEGEDEPQVALTSS